MIQLSIEFDNYHTVTAWYNLTDCRAVFIGEYEERLGVALDFETSTRWIFINESIIPYSDGAVLRRSLKDILECITASFIHYGDPENKYRVISD